MKSQRMLLNVCRFLILILKFAFLFFDFSILSFFFCKFSDCPGPQSETAGKSDSCKGCPNQEICATAPKGPDPGYCFTSFSCVKILFSACFSYICDIEC